MTETTKAEWLENRKLGIGGSDIPVILGLNSNKSPYQLWLEKTGKIDEIVDNNFTRAGIKLEPVVADWFEEAAGLQLINPGNEIIKHASHDYIIGTPDRVYIDKLTGETGILEIKTTGKSIDVDNIPLPWFCQATWYAGISRSNNSQQCETNYVSWFERVTCAFNFAQLKYDPDFFQYLADKAGEFWLNHVVKDTPPPPMNSKDVQAIYSRHVPGKQVLATEELAKLVKQTKEIHDTIKANRQIEDELKLKIQIVMADCESIIDYDGIPMVTWKASKGSMKFDEDAFKSEHPDTYAMFCKPQDGSRRFLLK